MMYLNMMFHAGIICSYPVTCKLKFLRDKRDSRRGGFNKDINNCSYSLTIYEMPSLKKRQTLY